MGDFHMEEGETRKLLAKTSKDCSRQGHRPQGEGQGSHWVEHLIFLWGQGAMGQITSLMLTRKFLTDCYDSFSWGGWQHG